MKENKGELIDFQEIHLDTVGNIYEYNGDIIRIITKKSTKATQLLLQSGLINELVKKKLLITTRISEYSNEFDSLVLQHKKISVYQHYSQWSYEMMKDAAILVLKINMLCNKYGYELKDCHQANIMFDGINPVWVDFGSIIKRENKRRWVAYDKFLKCYYYPLLLWRKGYDDIIRALYKSPNYLDYKELLSINYLLPVRLMDKIIKIVQCKKNLSYQYLVHALNKGRNKEKTQWGDYQDSYWNRKNERFEYEVEWIKKNYDLKSMIEIGANQGAFACQVSQQTNIDRIIASDYDQNAIDAMYLNLKKMNINNITPLLIDFVWMKTYELEKYKSDLLVANALTHHLLLTQGMTIEALVNKFAILTSKYVITEFMPKGVENGRVPQWYTFDWFMAGMEKKFNIICTKHFHNRIVIIGKRR